MNQDKQIKALSDLIRSAESSIRSAKNILEWMIDTSDHATFDINGWDLTSYHSWSDTIVEWVFTGDSMLGPDGSVYPVPQNYSSKSLLVQGSKLKATIENNGGIKYKIIEEIPYETSIGIVTKIWDKYEITTDKKTTESGNSGGSEKCLGITPRSRSQLRSYLVEAAWVAIRKDTEMQNYYRKHQGKNVKSVIIKIAHKMARRILSVIKTETPYQVNRNLVLEK